MMSTWSTMTIERSNIMQKNSGMKVGMDIHLIMCKPSVKWWHWILVVGESNYG